MNRFLIFSLFLLSIVKVFAQETVDKSENKNFIELISGEIFYFNEYIETTKPFFGESKLKVGDRKYEFSQVKSYRNGSEYFVSTNGVYGACTDFAERINIGKINTYRAFETVYNPGSPMMGTGGGMMMSYGGGTSTKEVYYYNKGNSQLKKMIYDNLVNDLVENQESMILLQSYKKARNKEALWYVIGGVAVLGGALTASEKTGNTTTEFNFETGNTETVDEYKFKPLNFGIAVGGLITIAINYWTSKNKNKYLKQAVFQYNN